MFSIFPVSASNSRVVLAIGGSFGQMTCCWRDVIILGHCSITHLPLALNSLQKCKLLVTGWCHAERAVRFKVPAALAGEPWSSVYRPSVCFLSNSSDTERCNIFAASSTSFSAATKAAATTLRSTVFKCSAIINLPFDTKKLR